MKYRKKSAIFILLAGLIISTAECTGSAPMPELTAHHELNFPSASAITVVDDRLLVFGDDSPYMLVMDLQYNRLDSIQYIPGTNARMPANLKADVEAVSPLVLNGRSLVIAFSSMTGIHRERVWLFEKDNLHRFTSFTIPEMKQALNLPRINIEGCAVVKNKLLLASRASRKHPENYLITVSVENDSILLKDAGISRLLLPSRPLAGISGLEYAEEKDLLLFTASVENTPDEITDGPVLGSYLGWIRNFSNYAANESIVPDTLIWLEKAGDLFRGQKVESLAVESLRGNTLMIHLCVDNDDGKSRLFRIRLNLPAGL